MCRKTCWSNINHNSFSSISTLKCLRHILVPPLNGTPYCLLKSYNKATPVSSVTSGDWADAAQCILGVAGFLPFEQKGIRQPCFLCFLTNAQLLIDVMHSLKLKLPPLGGLLCCCRHPVKLVNKSIATGLCLMSCLQFCWLCLLLSGFLSRLVTFSWKALFFLNLTFSPQINFRYCLCLSKLHLIIPPLSSD